MKVMEMYASNRTVLELEYFNEAGTGLGPTLEFYTLLSHELQKKGLGMWRFDDMPSEKATGEGRQSVPCSSSCFQCKQLQIFSSLRVPV